MFDCIKFLTSFHDNPVISFFYVIQRVPIYPLIKLFLFSIENFSMLIQLQGIQSFSM